LRAAKELRASVSFTGIAFIFTPFLLVGANQIQTDGSVGLFGFSLLLYSCVRGLDDRVSSTLLVLASGFLLALAKTELFVLGSVGLLAAAALTEPPLRAALRLALYGGGGAAAALVIAAMSVQTFGDLRGLFDVYGTVIRIGAFAAGANLGHADQGSILQGTKAVLGTLRSWRLHVIIVASVASLIALAALGRRRDDKKLLRDSVILAAFALPVPAAYLGVGWSGDGFPRYFLPAMPACLLAIAMLKRVTGGRPILPVAAIIYAVAFTSQIGRIYEQPVSRTGFAGQGGFEQAGVLLKELLPPGALVMGPDPVAYYYGRSFVDISLTEPYPEKWSDMVQVGYTHLHAWVYFRGQGRGPSGDRQESLWRKLQAECRVDRVIPVGSLEIAILQKPRC
jgi:hypothetical protein